MTAITDWPDRYHITRVAFQVALLKKLVMKTILVPTDFSLTADNALNYAVAVAIKAKAKIALVHAVQIDPAYRTIAFPGRLIEYEWANAEQRANYHLNALAEEVKEEHHIGCEQLSVHGAPITVIKDAVKRLKPFMVIMGTNGANSFSKRVLGSTTARIIGKVNCPVMAVPVSAKFDQLKSLLYALDFNQKEPVAIKAIKKLRALFNAHITVVHICEADDLQIHQTQLRQFKNKALKELDEDISFRIITAQRVNDNLLKLAGNKHYNMLVMLTHKRSFVESLMNSSETKKISNSIKIPLLALL